MRHLILAAAACAAWLSSDAVAAAGLVDGGFETPGAGTNVLPGNGFGGWSLGNAFSDGGVALSSTAQYAMIGGVKTYYQAQAGSQWLRLSGATDALDGQLISQKIATVTGGRYELSFYVGKLYTMNSPYIELLLDGKVNDTYSNTNNDCFICGTYTPVAYRDGVAGMSWQKWTVDFTAGADATTIGFFNGSGPGAFAALDSITLAGPGLDDAGPGNVPEPATWATMLGGFGLIGGALRRRRTVVA